MDVQIPYGDSRLTLTLPAQSRVLLPRYPSSLAD